MELPHAPLDHYYGAEANRQAWVREIFDRSAVDYERVHSAMALGTGAWYRRRALIGSGLRPGLREGMRVVDVGARVWSRARRLPSSGIRAWSRAWIQAKACLSMRGFRQVSACSLGPPRKYRWPMGARIS